ILLVTLEHYDFPVSSSMLRQTEERLLAFCLEQAMDFDSTRWNVAEELEKDLLTCACAYLKTTDWYPRARELRDLPTPPNWVGLTKACHFEVPRFKQRLQHGLAHLG